MRFVRPYVRGEKLVISTPTEAVRCVIEDRGTDRLLVATANSRAAQALLVKRHGFVEDAVVEAPVEAKPEPVPEPAPVKKSKKKAVAATPEE
jgi:hypothetical protein